MTDLCFGLETEYAAIASAKIAGEAAQSRVVGALMEQARASLAHVPALGRPGSGR